MREPIRWLLRPGARLDPASVVEQLRLAARGPAQDGWDPPAWLYPHQRDAARRLAGSLAAFGGAICADTVGLGKTYIALALATRYRRVTVIAPAILTAQWAGLAASLGVPIALITHERLSHGLVPDLGGLTIVDEAHRFRNPETRRYRALARALQGGHLLLVTATPVVNRAADLVALLRIFLADNGLALMGLPSLEIALARSALDAIARAAACVTVARSPRVLDDLAGLLPDAHHAALVTPSPVPRDDLACIVAAVGALRFPACSDRNAAALLDLHLRYRLASSLAAARQTLRQHRHYLTRAIAAAERGEHLPRSDVRSLIGEEWDGQIELVFGAPGGALDTTALRAEATRVDNLRATLDSMGDHGEKADQLQKILDARRGKTLVFTAAIATARSLARTLGWKRVAVVSGRGAWIASGRVTTEEALSLFAPAARGAGPVPRATPVDTLIATDLASEGLNLQDADAVVHYDLPWTPLRLSQRLGRVTRLGSPHHRVDVFWFAPPPELGAGPSLPLRLARKGVTQLHLGIPVTSTVGKLLAGSPLEWRERLANSASTVPRPGSGFAMVEGPAAAAAAISWVRGSISVPEIVVVEGRPPRLVEDSRRAGELVWQLIGGRIADGTPSGDILAAIARVVRARLAGTERLPGDPRTRELAQAVAALARVAATRRDRRVVEILDRTLGRIQGGLAAGRADQLADAIAQRAPAGFLTWLGVAPPQPPIPWTVTLQALLVGTGTAPVP